MSSPSRSGCPGHPSRAEQARLAKGTDQGGFAAVRVRDLRHTFGHRLRASGVSFKDRQDLLGHSSGRITTHYSAPDIVRLLQAVEMICEQKRMTILRLAAVAGDNYRQFRQNAIPAKKAVL
jgi:integrase